MLEEKAIPLGYVKKKDLPGSDNGIRFLFQSAEGKLKVWIWPEPYGFAATQEDLKKCREFDFSQDGIREAVDWINEENASDYGKK